MPAFLFLQTCPCLSSEFCDELNSFILLGVIFILVATLHTPSNLTLACQAILLAFSHLPALVPNDMQSNSVKKLHLLAWAFNLTTCSPTVCSNLYSHTAIPQQSKISEANRLRHLFRSLTISKYEISLCFIVGKLTNVLHESDPRSSNINATYLSPSGIVNRQ